MSMKILWRRVDLPGHEIARLDPLESGEWLLSGTALFLDEGAPCKLDYVITCSSDWHTRAARIVGGIGERAVSLEVAVTDEKEWIVNGIRCDVVQGCVDIDLGFSPATNLLPLRRLALAVGERASVRAAWLPFPSLEFEPLVQHYERQSASRYRYETFEGRFERVLEVPEVSERVKEEASEEIWPTDEVSRRRDEERSDASPVAESPERAKKPGFVTSYPGLWEREG